PPLPRRAPRRHLPALVEGRRRPAARPRAFGAAALGTRPAGTPRRGCPYKALGVSSLDQRRAGFQRYKARVKKDGKPFYPFAMFHDTVMSLVVVCVIIGLAVI